jgi:Family of unknown function (DUF5990)
VTLACGQVQPNGPAAGQALRGGQRAGGHRTTHTDDVQIRIEASDLPGWSCGPSPDSPGGYHNIHVGVQRRNRQGELLGLVPTDAPSATWTLDCTAAVSPAGTDLKGPCIQGPPGDRFIYLSWGTVGDDRTFTLFRRAKLWLNAIPPAVIGSALSGGMLVGRLGLTDARGNPLCAAVRPPVIQWSAEAAPARRPG